MKRSSGTTTVIRAEYNEDGYVVFAEDLPIYSAANAPAGFPVLGTPLPLSSIRSLAIETTRRMATEHGAVYGGVRRVPVLPEDEEPNVG